MSEHVIHPDGPAEETVSRRRALSLGLVAGLALVLPGCASSSRRRAVSRQPGPNWPGLERERTTATTSREPVRRSADPLPSRTTPAPPPGGYDVMPRTAWARGAPIPSRMDRIDRIDRITVHHDGMPPVTLRSRADVAHRIDRIRAAHQDRGWGDIGYHYVIDPLGQVWEGRPLTFQGAHVRDHNVRNLGVLLLGNFESQTPTHSQLASMERLLIERMRRHRVSAGSLHTHRELTPTICPGRNLQRVMNALRAGSGSLARV